MRIAAACVLLLACGHQRASVISAKVMRTESGTQLAAEGASGTLTCPSTLMPQDLGNADDEGQLRAEHIGAIPLECTVTIALSGYQPFTARVVDVCKQPASAKACAQADIAAVLAAGQGDGSNAGK